MDDEKVIEAEGKKIAPFFRMSKGKRLPLFSHVSRFINSIRHLPKCYKLGVPDTVLL